jgi:hypothetical protein
MTFATRAHAHQGTSHLSHLTAHASPVGSRCAARRGAQPAGIRATMWAVLLVAFVIVAVVLLLGNATSGEHFPAPSPAPAPAVLAR